MRIASRQSPVTSVIASPANGGAKQSSNVLDCFVVPTYSMSHRSGLLAMTGRGISFGLLAMTVIILSLSGCGYTTRSLLPAHIKTIYVENFKNMIDISQEISDKRPYRLYRPDLENEITRGVVERLVFDGNLKVIKDYDEADAILKGGLLEYIKEPLRYDENHEVTEFRVRLVVAVEFLDKRENKTLWQAERLAGESSQRTEGGLKKSEDTARQEAVEDAARRIVEKMIEIW